MKELKIKTTAARIKALKIIAKKCDINIDDVINTLIDEFIAAVYKDLLKGMQESINKE